MLLLPDWWMDFMLWLDNTTVPLWIVLFVLVLVIAYAARTLINDASWRDGESYDEEGNRFDPRW